MSFFTCYSHCMVGLSLVLEWHRGDFMSLIWYLVSFFTFYMVGLSLVLGGWVSPPTNFSVLFHLFTMLTCIVETQGWLNQTVRFQQKVEYKRNHLRYPWRWSVISEKIIILLLMNISEVSKVKTQKNYMYYIYIEKKKCGWKPSLNMKGEENQK